MSDSRLAPTGRESVQRLLAIRGEGLLTFNSEGRVSYTSPLFLAFTGAQALELDNITEIELSKWLAQRSQLEAPFSGVAQLRQRALQEKTRHKEVIRISAGSAAGIWLEVAWFSAQSDDAAGVLFLRDVSLASRAEQAQQQFLSTAAHDLRTPLASIAGFADVLQTQTLEAESQQAFLKIIADQAEHLTQMMSAVFELLRMDAQQSKDYRFVRSSLQSLSTNAVANLALPTGRIAPLVVMPASPLWVMADTHRLTQAITVVLTHAYQYASVDGGVRLEIFIQKNARQADTACLQVRDHRLGMALAHTLRGFDRSFHPNSATTTATDGLGLGLGLAKQIVEMHHGDIRAVSTPETGTQVEFSLPMSAPSS